MFALVTAALLSRLVHLSNVALPTDQFGRPLITGEASILRHDDAWYVYFNNYGGCAGVDCCNTTGGCSSCCMQQQGDTCVYTSNHSVVVYRTTDLISWQYLGVALSLDHRATGVEFRPHVVYNAHENRFVMWYEDRHPGQKGYAVAVSAHAAGPFFTITNSTAMAGPGRSDGSGDFTLLVDDDGAAYHIRDGFVIERLSDDYLRGTGVYGHFTPPRPSEGPVAFKRHGRYANAFDLLHMCGLCTCPWTHARDRMPTGVCQCARYYILTGSACCACRGGSSIDVFIAPSALGPYTYTRHCPCPAHAPLLAPAVAQPVHVQSASMMPCRPTHAHLSIPIHLCPSTHPPSPPCTRYYGDVGSDPARPYSPHSPLNFVTRAQGSAIFVLPPVDRSLQANSLTPTLTPTLAPTLMSTLTPTLSHPHPRVDQMEVAPCPPPPPPRSTQSLRFTPPLFCWTISPLPC